MLSDFGQKLLVVLGFDAFCAVPTRKQPGMCFERGSTLEGGSRICPPTPRERLIVFKNFLSLADDERLSVSSNPQFGLNGFHAISLGSALPFKSQFWMGTLRSKVFKVQQKHTKSGYFGNMLPFTDGLVSFGCVLTQCFGVSSGKAKWDC